MEPTGIEPVTSCLQNLGPTSRLVAIGRQRPKSRCTRAPVVIVGGRRFPRLLDPCLIPTTTAAQVHLHPAVGRLRPACCCETTGSQEEIGEHQQSRPCCCFGSKGGATLAPPRRALVVHSASAGQCRPRARFGCQRRSPYESRKPSSGARPRYGEHALAARRRARPPGCYSRP
jgi:hypothetical protein